MQNLLKVVKSWQTTGRAGGLSNHQDRHWNLNRTNVNQRRNIYLLGHYYNCETYVRDIPTRCFKCQKFGHIAKNCFNILTCPLCSKNHHKFECTETILKCANCDLSHAAYSKECEVLITKQKELTKRRIIERQLRTNHLWLLKDVNFYFNDDYYFKKFRFF